MQKSEDGFELTWAVNVVAPFLLTALLFDNIKERVVTASSISAGSSIDWNNLQQVRCCTLLAMYSRVSLLAPHQQHVVTALLFDNKIERVVTASSISAGGSIDWNNLQQVRCHHPSAGHAAKL